MHTFACIHGKKVLQSTMKEAQPLCRNLSTEDKVSNSHQGFHQSFYRTYISMVIKILKTCIYFGIEKEVRIRNCQKKKGPLNNFKGLLTLFTLKSE